jgi:hypothetical protein
MKSEPLEWEVRHDGRFEGFSVEPMAIYRIQEIPQGRRKMPHYVAAVLTEVGVVDMARGHFRTLQAAQRYCQKDVDKWRARMRLTQWRMEARDAQQEARP